MRYWKSNIQWLSIIEVMIGIFIFSLWISAIFMVIVSTLKVNTYNKNFIIASNLAREQIELIRNIRDTNYALFQKWNTLDPLTSPVDYSNVFTWSTTNFYKIENNFWLETIDTSVESSVSNFKQALQDWSDLSEDSYNLCLDVNKRYWYCDWVNFTIATPFYRYIEIQPLTDWSTPAIIIDNAFKVRSKVFWSQKWVHDTEIDTILTDWERL